MENDETPPFHVVIRCNIDDCGCYWFDCGICVM